MEIISTTKVCGGTLRRIKHASSSTKTEMTFAVFTPPTKLPPKDGFPALFWLSGLTCNDQNFAQKASPAFVAAANEGLAIVMPDTSPRGAGVPGEDDRCGASTLKCPLLNRSRRRGKKNLRVPL